MFWGAGESKHHRTTCSLIDELRTSARTSGKISVAGNELEYATVATSETRCYNKQYLAMSHTSEEYEEEEYEENKNARF